MAFEASRLSQFMCGAGDPASPFKLGLSRAGVCHNCTREYLAQHGGEPVRRACIANGLHGPDGERRLAAERCSQTGHHEALHRHPQDKAVPQLGVGFGPPEGHHAKGCARAPPSRCMLRYYGCVQKARAPQGHQAAFRGRSQGCHTLSTCRLVRHLLPCGNEIVLSEYGPNTPR